MNKSAYTPLLGSTSPVWFTARAPPPKPRNERLDSKARVTISRKEKCHGQKSLFVRLEAKPGKEKEVESFLLGALPLVMEEPTTTAWFGIRLGPSTYGVFDAFQDDSGRQAHLSGRVAAALMAKAGELFSKPPSIEKVDVLAAKLPG